MKSLFLLLLPPNSAEDFIFGYGSLVANTARDPNTQSVRIHGLRRCWCYNAWHVDPPQTALGVHLDQDKNVTTNGVITSVSPKRLESLDHRERDYTRKKVSWLDVDFVGGNKPSRLNGNLWAYVLPSSKNEPPTAKRPIAKSYVDICISGFLRIGGTSFAEEFIASTYGWKTSHVL